MLEVAKYLDLTQLTVFISKDLKNLIFLKDLAKKLALKIVNNLSK